LDKCRMKFHLEWKYLYWDAYVYEIYLSVNLYRDDNAIAELMNNVSSSQNKA
jgi:hypothetical protein